MSVPAEPADRPTLASSLEGHARLLWGVSIVLYGFGDLVTTAGSRWAGHAVEAGPVVSTAMGRYGLPGLLVVKVATLVGFFLVWRRLRTPGRIGIPLALTVVGAAVTGWNVVVLLAGAGPLAASALPVLSPARDRDPGPSGEPTRFPHPPRKPPT